jgi:type I restriction enzyme R subunit
MTKEAEIENLLIEKLQDLKYTYRKDIKDRLSLERNFREKFQALNGVELTDNEFKRLLDDIVSPDVFACSKRLRSRETFIRDDGTALQYSLVNIKDWCKNDYEVINQLRINTANSNQRYDVIILINGLPLVQIELKALDVSPYNAIQQIVNYKKDLGNGYLNTILCFMQLFAVSNRSHTMYFANNNDKFLEFNADEKYLPIYHFADKNNKKITFLDDFAEKFLPKCTLGETISRYMVLVAIEQKLLIMRPYQIYAVKAIVECIRQNRGNGYIWHTTGSGKTLTSFKASTLLKDNPDIEKCLFVVDRKDLDRQTREEFNKFQEKCVEENTNTEALVRRMLSDDYADKVIVTTIQKLGVALDSQPRSKKNEKSEAKAKYIEMLAPLRDKRIVFIFDECHRSQFGENHKAIKEFFPKAQLFGFTGTPIFEKNSTQTFREGENAALITTDDVFQKLLHSYTITNAIDDKNVLSFHVDYFKPEGDNPPPAGEAIAKKAVIDAILSKHDAATNHRKFNAIFATQSINDAIEYYRLFKAEQKKLQEINPERLPLNIACVFSPPAILSPNDKSAQGDKYVSELRQIQEDLDQEREDNKIDPEGKKLALQEIIDDYNKQFGANHSLLEFDSYYQNVQKRIKDHQFNNKDNPRKNKIDITIVVDMLLTGFDSKFLNTLYVDKKLKYHGLIQAFSRTNRILNESKPYGNILDFRQQMLDVDEAIEMFSGKSDAETAREIWLVDTAPVVIEKFEGAVERLREFMKVYDLPCEPSSVYNLQGDTARANFINCFKEVQRYKTQLDQYTDITPEQLETIESIMPEDNLVAFRRCYIDTAKELRKTLDKMGGDAPEELQNLDMELVLFASAIIDYDYIMSLISKFTCAAPGKQTMTREQIINLLSSNANLMDERDEVSAYIYTLQEGVGLSETQIRDGYLRFKAEKFAEKIAEIAQSLSLESAALTAFTNSIISRMIFDGEALTDLLAPLGLNWKGRREKENELMDKLSPLLKKMAQGREIAGLKAYE